MVIAIAVPQIGRLAPLRGIRNCFTGGSLWLAQPCTVDMARPGGARSRTMKPSSPEPHLHVTAAYRPAPFPALAGKDSRKRALPVATGRVHCSAGTTHPRVRQDDPEPQGNVPCPGHTPGRQRRAEKEIASWLRNAVDQPRGEAAARVEVNPAAAAAAAGHAPVAAAAAACVRGAARPESVPAAAAVQAVLAAAAPADQAAEPAADHAAVHVPAPGCDRRRARRASRIESSAPTSFEVWYPMTRPPTFRRWALSFHDGDVISADASSPTTFPAPREAGARPLHAAMRDRFFPSDHP